MSRYLELEAGVVGDGHVLDITWSPQDDVVPPREIDHLKCQCLGAVVAHVSEGDWQSDPPEWDGLLAQDNSVEWVWAALELIPSEPQPFDGVEVYEVEDTAPVHEGLGESGHLD
jgi:hypothetical protein